MSGDPDVLEYYKNDHSKKPIRVIDLHCCEQVDAGLTFKRKEFQDSFVFDIKTSDRTFYLVAETEEEMNKWVRSICQLCGFNQSDDSHGKGLYHHDRSSVSDEKAIWNGLKWNFLLHSGQDISTHGLQYLLHLP